MRTTVDIPDSLLERAKKLAVATGRRLTDVINDALTELFNRRDQEPPSRTEIPVFDGGADGGLQPGIEPTSNASYFEALDEEPRDPDSR